MTVQRLTVAAMALLVVGLVGCGRSETAATPSGNSKTVTQFLAEANENVLKLGNAANEAGWVQDNFITVDTQAISARANEAYVNAVTDYAKRAAQFPADAGTPEERRQLTVLKNTMTMAGPADPKKTAELTTVAARLAAAVRLRQVPVRPVRKARKAVSTSRPSPRSSRRTAIRSGSERCGKAGTPSARR